MRCLVALVIPVAGRRGVMRIVYVAFLGATLTGSTTAVGCGGSSSSDRSDDGGFEGSTFANDSGGSPDACGGGEDGGKSPAPIELGQFETRVEDTGGGGGHNGGCKLADWTNAQAVLDEANVAWAALQPEVLCAGAAPDLLAKIQAGLSAIANDIAHTSQKACENDANAVSLALTDLFDLYSHPVPTDVLRGDSAWRQLQIDGEYADWTAAEPDLSAAQALWMRLRPLTTTRAATRMDIDAAATVVADMDGAIAKASSDIGAKDAAMLQSDAQRGLDLIDTVEQTFE